MLAIICCFMMTEDPFLAWCQKPSVSVVIIYCSGANQFSVLLILSIMKIPISLTNRWKIRTGRVVKPFFRMIYLTVIVLLFYDSLLRHLLRFGFLDIFKKCFFLNECYLSLLLLLNYEVFCMLN